MTELPEFPTRETIEGMNNLLQQLVREVSQVELDEKWHVVAKKFLANARLDTKELHDIWFYGKVLEPTKTVARLIYEYIIMSEKLEEAHRAFKSVRDYSGQVQAEIAAEVARQEKLRAEYR